MKASLNITLGLLAVVGLWIVFMYPVGYIILTACVAVVAYIVSKDLSAVLGVAIFMVLFRVLGDILKPAAAKKEGFQPKDPITVHQRIVKEKVVQPQVSSVTGILESANIMDTMPVGAIRADEEGFTNSVQPAPNAMNLPSIPTPAESSMPQPTSTDTGVKMNPALITGADPAAVDTAMAVKGTALNAPAAAEVGGANSGPAPYA